MCANARSRHCVFCGSDGLTNEHVWPQWIGRLLSGVSSAPYKIDRLGKKWDTPKLEMMVKRVCGTCNQGWMSELELEVQSVLTPLILGDKKYVVLSPKDQDRIARWALKTALVADLIYGTPLIPRPWYEGFYRHGRPPNQCVIWTAAYGGTIAAVHLRRSEAELSSIDFGHHNKRGSDSVGFMLAFNIFRVVFQVLGYNPATPGDVLEVRSDPTDALAHRPWPLHGKTLFWPPHGSALGHEALEKFAYRGGIL